MKKLLLTLVLFSFGTIGFAQPKFTAATLDEYNKTLKTNPVETIKQSVHKDFQFINGKGEVNNYNDLLNFFTYFTEIERTMTDLKINQFGNSAIAMGTLTHAWHPKDNAKNVLRYTGKFTYTYVYENGKWMQTSAQHTDIAANKEQEAEAVRKAIEAESNAYYKGDVAAWKAAWANNAYTERQHENLKKLAQSPYLKGAALVKAHEEYAKTFKATGQSFKISDFEAHIAGNTAWATYTQETLKADGSLDYKERALRILEKINGEWKLVMMSFAMF